MLWLPERIALCIVWAAFCVCSLQAESRDLIGNGSFEQPALSANGFAFFSRIPGRTPLVLVLRSRWMRQPLVSHCDGRQPVELDSTFSSAMCQIVPSVAGKAYVLRFADSPRPNVADNRMNVLENGQLFTQLNRSGISLSDSDWEEVSFLVRATGTSTELRFAAAGASDCAADWIDGVSPVENSAGPVAHGSALLVWGVALGALGVWRLRRGLFSHRISGKPGWCWRVVQPNRRAASARSKARNPAGIAGKHASPSSASPRTPGESVLVPPVGSTVAWG